MQRWVALVVAVGLTASGCAWTQARGTADQRGMNPFSPGLNLASLPTATEGLPAVDRGLLSTVEVTSSGARVFAAGATDLWALDLDSGDELWRRARTFGHQFNTITAATAWTHPEGARVAMGQYFTDSISGTPYFQWIGRTDVLDAATGAAVGGEDYGAPFAPVEANGYVYFPQAHVVAKPISLGASSIRLAVVARPIEPGTGTEFQVNFSIPDIPTSIAVTPDTLFIRTATEVVRVPARGCGSAVCAATTIIEFGAVNDGQLIVGDGVLFERLGSGAPRAYDLGCVGVQCAPTWTADVAAPITGMALVRDRLFVTTGPTLAAFDASGCGAPTCPPMWTSTAPGSLTVPSAVNDMVLAGSASGDLLAWSADGCAARSCPVAWSKHYDAAVGPVSPIDRALLFVTGGALHRLEIAGG